MEMHWRTILRVVSNWNRKIPKDNIVVGRMRISGVGPLEDERSSSFVETGSDEGEVLPWQVIES
jgi:hypothetical protein